MSDYDSERPTPPRPEESRPPRHSRQEATREPKSSRNRTCFGCAVAAVLSGALFMLLLGLAFIGMLGEGISTFSTRSTSANGFNEKLIEPGTGLMKIVIIDVEGIITSFDSLSGPASSPLLIRQLRQAGNDPQVAAIILNMNTPGGEVIATDEVYHEIQKLREDRQIPVVTCMRTVAASGGYYLAAGTDHIVANRMTFTGSIGVIVAGYNISRLLESWKVEPVIYKSGNMKDIMSLSRPPSPEEQRIMASLVEQTFHEFALIVAKGRNLPLEDIKNPAGPIGDGRIMSGTQALEAGLVDELGFLEDAIAKARQLGQAAQASVVRYEEPPTLGSLLFGIESTSQPNRITIEIPGTRSLELERGTAYFLSPMSM